MAVIRPTIIKNSREQMIVSWDNMQKDDTAAPVNFGGYVQAAWLIYGTGGGATIGTESSPDDGATWVDSSGPWNIGGTTVPLSAGAAVGPSLMRPKLTGGDNTTDVTFYIEVIRFSE